MHNVINEKKFGAYTDVYVLLESNCEPLYVRGKNGFYSTCYL